MWVMMHELVGGWWGSPRLGGAWWRAVILLASWDVGWALRSSSDERRAGGSSGSTFLGQCSEHHEIQLKPRYLAFRFDDAIWFRVDCLRTGENLKLVD